MIRIFSKRRGNPERQFERTVIQYLRLNKILCWPTRNEMLRGRWDQAALPGLPDVMGILPDGSGRVFGIELKMKGRKLTAPQLVFAARANDLNAIVFSAWSLDDVIKGLEGYLTGRVN